MQDGVPLPLGSRGYRADNPLDLAPRECLCDGRRGHRADEFRLGRIKLLDDPFGDLGQDVVRTSSPSAGHQMM